MNKCYLFLIVAVLFFIVPGGLFAQNMQELRPGIYVSGNLSSGGENWYSLRPTETGFVVVETTGDIDTCMEFYDSQRKLITEDDDGGEGYNARIETLAESGKTYYVKITGYDDESGPYRIRATYKPLPATTELRFGTTVSGNLSSRGEGWYRVRSAQAGLVTVETTSSIDTVIDVYNSSWVWFDSDDDSGEGENARLEIVVEANQTYYFKVRGYDDEDIGPFRILASFESIPQENNTERTRAITLKLGEAVSVFLLKQGESRWYAYTLARAATFVVQTRGSMDTLLYLYDNNRTLIEEDDDSGEGNNARISQRLNPGTYYIEVKGYDGTGRCTLHAELR
jgi:hypothetical protein